MREAGRPLPRLRHLPQRCELEGSLSKAAQYYNADLVKIDLQYQQSRKNGGKDDQPDCKKQPDEK